MAEAFESIQDRRSTDRGATSVEYALLAAFIAAAIVGTVLVLGGTVTSLFELDIPGF